MRGAAIRQWLRTHSHSMPKLFMRSGLAPKHNCFNTYVCWEMHLNIALKSIPGFLMNSHLSNVASSFNVDNN